MVRHMSKTALLLVLCAACVTTSTHEKALADLNQQHEQEMAKEKAETAATQKKLEETETARKDLEAKLAEAQKRADELNKLLQGSAADKEIHSSRFPSNWELSTERAVTVTRFLISKGMKPESLGATGYGEFDPLVPNDSDDHRAQNRRIEIQLQPNLGELPSMEDLAKQ